MRDDEKPDAETGADSEDMFSAIRSLVEKDDVAPGTAAPAPTRARPSAEVKPAPDRWAHLRAKFADLDDDENEDEIEVSGEDRWVEDESPATEAKEARSPKRVDEEPQEIAHYFEDEHPAAPDLPPEPEIAPEHMTRMVWDSPEDHVMGKRARTAWRIAVYGTLIALPASFFVFSPFSPRDTVQHHVSAMGCQFAALFDYENIEIGEPGYHAHLDEDADGIACEVKKTRISMGGNSGFKRP